MGFRSEERSDRVRLSADVARCEPGLPCPMSLHCARYLAALPAAMAVMMDGTSDLTWSPTGCPHYIPVRCDKSVYKGPERRVHKHFSE